MKIRCFFLIWFFLSGNKRKFWGKKHKTFKLFTEIVPCLRVLFKRDSHSSDFEILTWKIKRMFWQTCSCCQRQNKKMINNNTAHITQNIAEVLPVSCMNAVRHLKILVCGNYNDDCNLVEKFNVAQKNCWQYILVHMP